MCVCNGQVNHTSLNKYIAHLKCGCACIFGQTVLLNDDDISYAFFCVVWHGDGKKKKIWDEKII